MEQKNKVRGYKDEFYPPVPTKATRFWRTNIIYQFYKFWRLNYKIMRIVAKGHS